MTAVPGSHPVECYRNGPWQVYWLLGRDFAVRHLAMPGDVTLFTAVDEPVDQVDAGRIAYRWWSREGGYDQARAARAVITASG